MPYGLGFAIVFLGTFSKKIYFGMKSGERGQDDGKGRPRAPPFIQRLGKNSGTENKRPGNTLRQTRGRH
jgi:hypothetical protein